ncbi:hypothetical protein RQP46_003707 [Phenoliferia psychrophenolica]
MLNGDGDRSHGNATASDLSGAQRRFRDFVASSTNSDSNVLMLDFYSDIAAFSELAAKLRAVSQSIEEVYLQRSSPHRLALPISIRGPVLETLSQCRTAGASIAAPEHDLLAALFASDFQSYIQHELIEHAVGKLGTWRVNAAGGDGFSGLADCYCLTNPRLRDHPITLASEGFAKLTGYPLDLIVGRNCRFLQGPGTAPDSVRRLREALNSGVGITSLLLNYRLDGRPFFNLLPLKDSTGAVKYFLGGQIDVTMNISALLGKKALSTDDSNSSVRPKARSHMPFSTAVKARAEEISNHSPNSGATGTLSPTGILRRPTSRSTIGSQISISDQGRQELKPLSPMASIFRSGKSKKASKGNELGLTTEEHAQINAADPLQVFRKLMEFQSTYSRVILFRKGDRAILFATPELLAFCGLPETSAHDLVGSDFLKVLGGVTKEDSSRLRRNIKAATDQGHSYSLAVGLQIKTSQNILLRRKTESDRHLKQCILHLTPLCDQRGDVEAYVAVFGGQ